MTIEELLAENKRLKEENNRLKGLLRKNNIDYTFEKEKTLTMDDKIKIYLSYFKGRNDVYAEKYIKDGKKSYSKVCDNRFNRNLCDKSKYKYCNNCPNEKRKDFGAEEVYNHLNGEKAYIIDDGNIVSEGDPGFRLTYTKGKDSFLFTEWDDKGNHLVSLFVNDDEYIEYYGNILFIYDTVNHKYIKSIYY